MIESRLYYPKVWHSVASAFSDAYSLFNHKKSKSRLRPESDFRPSRCIGQCLAVCGKRNLISVSRPQAKANGKCLSRASFVPQNDENTRCHICKTLATTYRTTRPLHRFLRCSNALLAYAHVATYPARGSKIIRPKSRYLVLRGCKLNIPRLLFRRCVLRYAIFSFVEAA